VVAAVDLNELAEAAPSSTRLVDTPVPLRTWNPQTVGDHPLAQGLDRDGHAVKLRQLLVSQSRAEVGVVEAYEPDGVGADFLGDGAIAGATPLARDEAAGSQSLVRAE
jgi:hypothetical protein